MDHLKQFETLFTERQGSIDGTWDQIERYFAPMRGGNFFQPQTTESELTFSRPRIYSDVPISASANLASTLHGNLTSSVLECCSVSSSFTKLTDVRMQIAQVRCCGLR